MKNYNFLIVGTIRNCERTLFKTIKCLDNVFLEAKKYEYFLVESDSSDKSLVELEKLNKRNNFSYISLGKLKKELPIRTERIAFCRNKYIDLIFNDSNYQWVDYLVIVDFDGVCTSLKPRDFYSCWQYKNWDVFTANTADIYYDIWALRHNNWSPNDCWQNKKDLIKIGFNKKTSEEISINSRMIKINPNSDIIKVDSAFGGLAIYRINSIPREAHYQGQLNKIEICEHVFFNKFITSNGGEIFINPKLIIGKAPFEHKKSQNQLFRFFKKINSYIKKKIYKI